MPIPSDRTAAGPADHRVERRTGLAIAALSAAAAGVATLTPIHHALPTHFATHCYACGEAGVVDVLLNLLLFVPLGLGLGLARWRWFAAVLAAFALSGFVELMQLLVVVGRDASLSDLTNNTLGGALGWALASRWRIIVFPRPVAALRLAAAAAALWLVVVAGTAWAVRPDLSGPATLRLRSVGDRYAYFPGAVARASLVGSRPIDAGASGRWDPTPGVSVDVATTAPASAWADVVAGDRATMTTAAIAGVFDTSASARLVLGQRGRSLVYAARLRAGRLKLRAPIATLRAAFPAPDAASLAQRGDSARVWGAIVGDSLRIGMATRGASHELAFVLSPYVGWTMLLFWDIDATPASLDALSGAWVLGLLLPGAYWAGLAARRWPWATVVPAAAATVGVFAIPLAFGRTAASSWVIAGAVLALVFGRTLAALAGRRREVAR